MKESMKTNQNIAQAVLAIKQAEKVFELTTSWRIQVRTEVGYEDTLYTFGGKVMAEVATEVMRRQIALYEKLEGSPMSYEDAMSLAVDEQK